MTYDEFRKMIGEDPTHVAYMTTEQLQETYKDWSGEQKRAALAEYRRVKSCLGGHNEVFVVHPKWRTDDEMSAWGCELLTSAIEFLKAQPWIEWADIPRGSLWHFRRTVLEDHYEIWYKGKMIPSEWE